MREKQKTSWGKVAEWYEGVVLDKDSYQHKVITPNVLRLLSPKLGERVLHLACGEGYFSRLLAEKGAKVTGVDVSPELIAKAKSKGGGTFVLHEAHKLLSLASNTFDSAISILSLQNIRELDGAIKELSRVLKPGGKITFVLNHPSFRVPQSSDWGFDEVKRIQYRKVWKYLKESTITILMNPGKKDSAKTYSFHRPLQTYIKTLAKHRFAVTNLEEWESHKKSARGPRERAENEARKEIPLFLAIEAKKLL